VNSDPGGSVPVSAGFAAFFSDKLSSSCADDLSSYRIVRQLFQLVAYGKGNQQLFIRFPGDVMVSGTQCHRRRFHRAINLVPVLIEPARVQILLAFRNWLRRNAFPGRQAIG
jgi:hypothetical protein